MSLVTGPVIISSVKWEVLFHTAAICSKRGGIWALDLGGGVPADVARVKWSPAYAETGWDSARFIHTSDTLYIAASSEEQNASAGLIAALLGAFTREQKRAFNENGHSGWLNLVVDGAASVACPALDTWASQFGGQGISLTVGLQDLSQARAAWPGVNFLGLFPSTILLPGIRDEQTLHTFSRIAGEFGRQLIGTSETVIRPDSWTQNNDVHRSTSTNYRTEKGRVVPVEAIAQMSQGECMVWKGSTWKYVGTHPWDGEYFTGYVEKVPQQWRKAIPSKTLLSKVTDKPGDEILRQAAQIDAESRGRGTHRNG